MHPIWLHRNWLSEWDLWEGLLKNQYFTVLMSSYDDNLDILMSISVGSNTVNGEFCYSTIKRE